MAAHRGDVGPEHVNEQGYVDVPSGEWWVWGAVHIEAGTRIRFPRAGLFNIRGPLFGTGTPSASITLASEADAPYRGIWYGVQVAGSGSRVAHTRFEYAQRGLTIDHSDNARVEYLSFGHCHAGLHFYQTRQSTVENSEFRDSYGSAFEGGETDKIRVMDSRFVDNQGPAKSSAIHGLGQKSVVARSAFRGGMHSSDRTAAVGGVVEGSLLIDNVFERNTNIGGRECAGALVLGSDNVVRDTLFSASSVANNGNAYYCAGAVVMQTRNRIVGSTFIDSAVSFIDRPNALASVLWFASVNNLVERCSFSRSGTAEGSVGVVGPGGENVVRNSNFLSNAGRIARRVDSRTAMFQVMSCYIAGNNGAAPDVVDMSEGTTSTATPPQWDGITVVNPRSAPHPDAPPIPTD